MVGTTIDQYGLDVARIVHGFDTLLIKAGSPHHRTSTATD